VGGNLKVKCTLPPGSILDLEWWVSNLSALNGKDFSEESLTSRYIQMRLCLSEVQFVMASLHVGLGQRHKHRYTLIS
jgi:hypothetical protein